MFLLAGIGSAARVAIPEIGLSVDVPQGWVLGMQEDASWILEDTTTEASGDSLQARHNGLIWLEAFSGAAEVGTSTWAKNDAYAWRVFLESQPCYGWVYRYDSTLVDGRFAMFVQGDWSSCPDTVDGVLKTEDYSVLVRTVAQGDVGWELSVVTDTLDFIDRYEDYRAVLDSIKIDPSFVKLGVGVYRKQHRSSPSIRALPHEGSWVLSSTDGTTLCDVRVLDANGRDIGRLEQREGSWIWTPEGRSGMAWVVSGSGESTRTARIPSIR